MFKETPKRGFFRVFAALVSGLFAFRTESVQVGHDRMVFDFLHKTDKKSENSFVHLRHQI